jgi:DNA-binding LytR/AlgR family response regulator
MPTCIICEDEELLRSQLKETLTQTWPELTIVGEAGDGVTGSRMIDDLKPDIAFLDIRMPGMSGIDVARHAAGRCHIVFITAYDEYAIRAFEQGAVDYVLKPVEPARFLTTVARLKARMSAPPADLRNLISQLGTRPEGKLRWIQASIGNTIKFITVDEVFYFQSDTKYTRVVTAQGESLIRKPLRELLDELDGEAFWQIHRGTIINVARVAAIQRDGEGGMTVLLKDCKDKLPVSQTWQHRFRQN